MKIFICTDKEHGHVTGLGVNYPADTTDAELKRLIENYNLDTNSYRRVSMLDVDDIVYEAFCFLLEQYRSTYELTDLIERIESLKGAITDAAKEIGNISTDVDIFCRYAKKILNKKES